MDSGNVEAVLRQLISQAGDGGSEPPPLNPPGGGGNSGDMEPRIARLEAHMENVRGELGKLASVPVELAIVKTKVEHLPGKGFVVTAALSTIAGVAALLKLLQTIGVLH